MAAPDLYSLREFCASRRIMLCLNGPMSRSLIEEMGNALRNYLRADKARSGLAMDVFAVYIEMTQNIRHYAARMAYDEVDATSTVVIARDEQGRHMVSAGNLVEAADVSALQARVDTLAALDQAELKAVYKKQLRAPRDESRPTGAGLGLIAIARKSSAPLQATVSERPDGKVFFSLTAII